MRVYSYYIGFIILITLFFSGCTDKPNGFWVQTLPTKTKIWLASIDTSLTYQWEGETFDSVANGKGVLTILKN